MLPPFMENKYATEAGAVLSKRVDAFGIQPRHGQGRYAGFNLRKSFFQGCKTRPFTLAANMAPKYHKEIAIAMSGRYSSLVIGLPVSATSLCVC